MCEKYKKFQINLKHFWKTKKKTFRNLSNRYSKKSWATKKILFLKIPLKVARNFAFELSKSFEVLESWKKFSKKMNLILQISILFAAFAAANGEWKKFFWNLKNFNFPSLGCSILILDKSSFSHVLPSLPFACLNIPPHIEVEYVLGSTQCQFYSGFECGGVIASIGPGPARGARSFYCECF